MTADFFEQQIAAILDNEDGAQPHHITQLINAATLFIRKSKNKNLHSVLQYNIEIAQALVKQMTKETKC